jgi:hypothetical protein
MAGKETVKGTFGNESIELNNAASEATLMAMLKIAQKDSAVLAQMAKQAGIDAKKMEDLLAESHDGGGGNKGVGLLGGAANLAGGFLMDMVGSIGKTIGSLMNFSESLMDGTARASDFFKAFSGLPLGLGLFADALAFSQKFMEKQIDTYRTISQTGAGLTSSLGGLRIQALSLGLSMDEFAQMFQKNQAALSVLGGSASAGAKNLVEINKQLINSRLGGTLMGLGYSFNEINGLIGDYLAVTSDGVKVNRSAASEQARLAKAAGEYGKELDFLSRLTGESREALQQKMAADAQEASWKMYLAGLPEEQQKLAAQAVERARLLGGKGGVDAIKAMFMGFAGPFSQEGQTFVATMNGGTRALNAMVTAVKSGQKSTTVMSQLDDLYARGVQENIKDLDKFKNAIYAMGQGSEGGARAMLEITEATNKFRAQGLTEEAAIKQAIIDARKKAAQDAAAAEGQAKADLAMKQFGAQLVTALLPVIEKLAKAGQSLIQKFIAFTENKGLMDKLQAGIERVIDYVSNILTKEGRDKIINDFKDLLKQLLIEIKLAFKPFYNEGDASKERNKMLLNDRLLEAQAKLAAAKQQELDDMEKQKAFDSAIKDKEKLDDAKARIEKIQNDKKLSDEVKRTEIAKINDSVEAERTRQNLIKNLDKESFEKQKAADDQHLKNAQTMVQNYQNRYNNWSKVGFDYKQGIKTENQAEWDYETGRFKREQYAMGTLGTGTLIKDFGKSRTVDLHGKEAVLTEAQLANMAQGIQQSSGGSTINIESLNVVAEGIISLNRQAAMQNKILNQMVENQRTMINRSTGNRLMV